MIFVSFESQYETSYQPRPYRALFNHNSAYWLSRSSKVSNFYVILKTICHFLLMINSNLCRISYRFWDMVSFFVEKRTFFIHHSFNPQFENVPVGVDGWNFACPSLRPMANYSCKNLSATPYPLATIQTDRLTDDNHANSSTVTKVRSANNNA